MIAANAIDWPSALPRLGIGPEFLTGKHGPCPGCGGRDRFRFDNKNGRGTWYCSGGGGEPSFGDGADLLCHVHGWTLREAFRAVREALGTNHEGIGSPSPLKPAPNPAQRPVRHPPTRSTQPYAISIWASVDRSDHAVASHPYARVKGIDWHAGVGRATASGRVIGKNADCIVVPIRDIETGNVAAVQCINRDGAKQTFGPTKGHAFIIGNDLDKRQTWYIVEGWGDACSVFRRHRGTCAFAAMGLNNFELLTERIVAHHQPRRLVLVEDAV